VAAPAKFLAVIFIAAAAALPQDLREAEALYQHTEYQKALQVLRASKRTDAAYWVLSGKCHLMLGNNKAATEDLQKAVDLEPRNSEYVMWLGRSWGRRAESASPLTAPFSATKARDFFSKAVELDPENRDALGDLFDYYLEAPAIMGGGVDKAEAIARRVLAIDPPQGHFVLAQVDQKRQRLRDAEQELKTSVKLAPDKVGHVIGLARFLAHQARLEESDAMLAQAESIAPSSPRVLYGKASIYIETHRKMEEARALLRRYLQAPLTPDDPPRASAEKLLKRAGS
jgi:tetratricopeptide (TPR) repeat protein